MKKILSLAFLAASITASAQEFNFKGTQGLFNSAMAVSEMVSLEHTVDAEGNPIIVMESRNGAKYTSPAEGVEIDVTPRSLPSSRCKFRNLIETAQTFNDIDELEFGDFIGVASKADYSFDEYVKAFYWMGETLGIDLAGMMKPFLQLNTAELGLKNKVMQENIRIQVYDIIYVGSDSQGQKVPFSARFVWPYNANENNPITLTNFYVENHVTLTMKGTEPSNLFWSFSAQPVCTKGYFVIQPDLIGFGATAQYSQQYVDKEINGADVAYSVVAAQQFIEWNNENQKVKGFTMDAHSPVILAGTSQGATSSLAGVYYIENRLDKWKYNIDIKESHICSGAYNMKLSMDIFAKDDILDYPTKVPLFFIGVATAHPELLTDGKKQLTIHDYFLPHSWYINYIDQETGIDYGNFWQATDMLINTRATQAACAYAFYDPEVQAVSLRSMLTPDQFNSDMRSINWKAPKMQGLKKYLAENNLCDPKIWKPKSPIKLYCTTDDPTVPPMNSYQFLANMFPYNHDVTLTITTELPDVFPREMGYGNHMALCFLWWISEITGIDINLVAKIIGIAVSGDENAAIEMGKAAMMENSPELSKALSNMK